MRLRATSAATNTISFSCSRGVRCIAFGLQLILRGGMAGSPQSVLFGQIPERMEARCDLMRFERKAADDKACRDKRAHAPARRIAGFPEGKVVQAGFEADPSRLRNAGMTDIQSGRVAEPAPARNRAGIAARTAREYSVRAPAADGRRKRCNRNERESNPNSSPLAIRPAASVSHPMNPAFGPSETAVDWLNREPANGMTTSGKVLDHSAIADANGSGQASRVPALVRSADGKCGLRRRK